MCKIHTLDCSNCGKPIGWSFTKPAQQCGVLCGDCLYVVKFVMELVGLPLVDTFAVRNSNNESYDDCLKKCLVWNKNVYSSVMEIEE